MKKWLILLLGALNILIAQGQELQTGVALDTIVCKINEAQSYALYLPTTYGPEKKWPIVYVFEPAARGSLPVNKYAPVAEELGFILACSNNSRNGDWQVGLDAADAVFQDTQQRLSIDTDRVFTMGFSGGSRLALSIAMITRRIQGVIGVGATQPPRPDYQMNRKADILYAGLVGNRDMNYQEHKQFASMLDEWGKKQLLLISELNHQWASTSDFKIAMAWMFYQLDEGDPTNLVNWMNSKVESASDSMELVDIIRLEQLIEQLDPSFQARAMDKRLEKAAARTTKKEFEHRIQLRDSLNKAIRYHTQKSTRRWLMNEIMSLQKKGQRAKELEQGLMYSRILDFIRAMSVETGFRLINNQEYEQAKVCIDVWSVYSENQRIKYWWYAKIAGLQGKASECLEFLALLAKEGFSDTERMENEPAFDVVKSTQKYQQILNKMK